MELEMEKSYDHGFILIGKKKYIGYMSELNPHGMMKNGKYSYKLDSKGTVGKRRDYSSITKQIYDGVVDPLLDTKIKTKEEKVKIAISFAKKKIEDLLNYRVPLDDLVITKMLTDGYKARTSTEKADKKKRSFGPHNIFVDDLVDIKGRKGTKEDRQGWKVIEKVFDPKTPLKTSLKITKKLNGDVMEHFIKYNEIALRSGCVISYDKIIDENTTEEQIKPITQAHVRLARKMALRDKNSAPNVGERLPFVFVEGDSKLQYMKTEHPDYAEKNNLKYDPLYYLEKQIQNSIGQILDTVLPGSSDKFFKDAHARYDLRKTKQKQMNGEYNEEIVLDSTLEICKKKSHARKKKKIESKKIFSFFKKVC